MSLSTPRDAVNSYLHEYAHARVGDCPQPTGEVIQLLRESPEESFNELLACLGEARPCTIDPRDIDIPIGKLLMHIANLLPELIIEKLSETGSHHRSMYIHSAAASQDVVFVSHLLDLLKSRSKFVKDCVLLEISRWPHLQVPEAVPLVENLSKQKSFTSAFDRRELEKAITVLEVDSTSTSKSTE